MSENDNEKMFIVRPVHNVSNVFPPLTLKNYE